MLVLLESCFWKQLVVVEQHQQQQQHQQLHHHVTEGSSFVLGS